MPIVTCCSILLLGAFVPASAVGRRHPRGVAVRVYDTTPLVPRGLATALEIARVTLGTAGRRRVARLREPATPAAVRHHPRRRARPAHRRRRVSGPSTHCGAVALRSPDLPEPLGDAFVDLRQPSRRARDDLPGSRDATGRRGWRQRRHAARLRDRARNRTPAAGDERAQPARPDAAALVARRSAAGTRGGLELDGDRRRCDPDAPGFGARVENRKESGIGTRDRDQSADPESSPRVPGLRGAYFAPRRILGAGRR